MHNLLDVLAKADTAEMLGLNLVNFNVVPETPIFVSLKLHDGKEFVAVHTQEVTIKDGVITFKGFQVTDLETELELAMALSMTRPMTEDDMAVKSEEVVLENQVFGQVDVPTKNGNIYPRMVMQEALDKLKVSCVHGLFGELGQRADTTVDLSRTSHQILGVEINEQGQVIGKVKVLNTGFGPALKKLLEDNAHEFALRGLVRHRANPEGPGVIVDHLDIVTFDAVYKSQ